MSIPDLWILDGALSLRWYDAQGCIQSRDFDFMEQLPLFVLMIMIFQRFTPRALGLSQRDSTKVEVGGKSFYINEEAQQFQLHGRRTFGSPASTEPPILPTVQEPQTPRITRSRARENQETESTSVGDNNSGGMEVELEHNGGDDDNGEKKEDDDDEDDEDYIDDKKGVSPAHHADIPFEDQPFFFKSSWAECAREKEFIIINTAHERSKKHLGEYARMVNDYIPKVEASQACTTDSTAIIRLFIKYAGGYKRLTEDDIKKQARDRHWMVCKRLKPVKDLPPEKFWKVFWDIVRCKHSHSRVSCLRSLT